MTNIHEQRRLCAIIRQAMLHDWDPIGVQDIPEAQDEYDSYVGAVFTLVEKRSTAAEIFQYLWTLETDHMGLTGDRETTQRVASALAALGEQR